MWPNPKKKLLKIYKKKNSKHLKELPFCQAALARNYWQKTKGFYRINLRKVFNSILMIIFVACPVPSNKKAENLENILILWIINFARGRPIENWKVLGWLVKLMFCWSSNRNSFMPKFFTFSGSEFATF